LDPAGRTSRFGPVDRISIIGSFRLKIKHLAECVQRPEACI
jgi:hypothetical protein